jgi:hypothetical protein
VHEQRLPRDLQDRRALRPDGRGDPTASGAALLEDSGQGSDGRGPPSGSIVSATDPRLGNSTTGPESVHWAVDPSPSSAVRSRRYVAIPPVDRRFGFCIESGMVLPVLHAPWRLERDPSGVPSRRCQERSPQSRPDSRSSRRVS